MFSKSKTAINRPSIPKRWTESLVVGFDEVCRFISELVARDISSRGGSCVLALDCYLGADWGKAVHETEELLKEKGFKVETIDINSYYKTSDQIEKIVNPLLTCDRYFGRMLDGELEEFLNLYRIEELKRKLRNCKSRKPVGKSQEVAICFGWGSANNYLKSLYDFIFYIDITREEFVKRAQQEGFGFLSLRRASQVVDQVADVGLPVHLFKLTNYVYYPMLERYKKRLLGCMDFYVDGNLVDEPKAVSRDMFDGILSILAKYPVRLKPLYVPSPWGGQWIKKIRNLPKSMVNCAWSFEAIAAEMSLKVAVGANFLEIPFLSFLYRESEKIMGSSAVKRFHDFFPIRVHYDDSMEGGNMAIQVHPTTSYVKERFNERVGQDESYYIVHAAQGSKVYLGLNEETDDEEFIEAVRRSETQRVPLDYDKYINSIPSKPGDLFLIPAGTVHASGRNEVVLEIGNGYGYTFHIYDYLRPDLSGRLRPIHSHHAFNVTEFERRTRWVSQHLRQQPRLIRSGQDWAEYLLGKLREISYVVHRLEFQTRIDDDTKEGFHILTLVEGEKMAVQSKDDPERRYELSFSETVIVPACFGKYLILNLGQRQCKVLKVLLK